MVSVDFIFYKLSEKDTLDDFQQGLTMLLSFEEGFIVKNLKAIFVYNFV